MTKKKRPKGDAAPPDARYLVARHVELALIDEFGHGTHVPGITAGGLPAEVANARVFERKFKTDSDGVNKVKITLVKRVVRDPRAFFAVWYRSANSSVCRCSTQPCRARHS